jgi:hypothetical protein
MSVGKKIIKKTSYVVTSNKVLQFYKRWSLSIITENEFIRFRNRILIIIDNKLGKYILSTPSVTARYCFFSGSHQQPQSTTDPILSSILEKKISDNPIYRDIQVSSNLPTLIFSLQSLLWTLEEEKYPFIAEVANDIQTAINYSPGIEIRIINIQERYEIVLAGVRILDKKLVDPTLEWISQYDKPYKLLAEALRLYSTKDKTKYRNVLDNLRLCIELIVKSVLHNNSPIEKQRIKLLAWLKNKGMHQQIINMYCDLLDKYSLYQNDAVKHDVKYKESEMEFIIYLSINFLFLLANLVNNTK